MASRPGRPPPPPRGGRGPGAWRGASRGEAGSRPEGTEHDIDALEAGPQVLGLVAEADAQETVHPELVPRHHEDALLVAQTLHESSGVDRPRVPRIGDGSRPRGDEAEGVGVSLHPLLEHPVVPAHAAARAREYPRSRRGGEGPRGEEVGEGARGYAQVVLAGPELRDRGGGAGHPADPEAGQAVGLAEPAGHEQAVVEAPEAPGLA